LRGPHGDVNRNTTGVESMVKSILELIGRTPLNSHVEVDMDPEKGTTTIEIMETGEKIVFSYDDDRNAYEMIKALNHENGCYVTFEPHAMSNV
jgi:hypothetical protein